MKITSKNIFNDISKCVNVDEMESVIAAYICEASNSIEPDTNGLPKVAQVLNLSIVFRNLYEIAKDERDELSDEIAKCFEKDVWLERNEINVSKLQAIVLAFWIASYSYNNTVNQTAFDNLIKDYCYPIIEKSARLVVALTDKDDDSVDEEHYIAKHEVCNFIEVLRDCLRTGNRFIPEDTTNYAIACSVLDKFTDIEYVAAEIKSRRANSK